MDEQRCSIQIVHSKSGTDPEKGELTKAGVKEASQAPFAEKTGVGSACLVAASLQELAELLSLTTSGLVQLHLFLKLLVPLLQYG